MYDEHYVKAPSATYYLKGRGYTEEDFVRAFSRVAGTDMQSFYDRYIRGVDVLPYDAAFAAVGLRLVKTANEKAFTGIVIERGGAGLRLGALPTGGPAAKSGLQQGDQLVAIGGSLVNRSNWQTAVDRFNPGDRMRVQVDRYGRDVNVEVTVEEPASFSYRLEELPSATEEARRLRAGWLTGR
jgi:predicted metalloprotease with PDZ domain